MEPNEVEKLKLELQKQIAINTKLNSLLEDKEVELEKVKYDLDHINNFIVEEIRTHVEEVDKLAKLPEENPSPIFRFSKRGKILIYCNGPGQSLLNEIDNSDNAEVQAEWKNALEKIQENSSSVTYHEIKLLEKTYLISIIDVKSSNYKNVYATDISNLKKIESALRESELRYKNVVENASDIVYNTDANGYFTYINPIAERKAGYTIKDLENKLFIDLIREDYKKIVLKKYIEQKSKKTESTYLEFPIIAKNGSTVWLGQNVQIIRENDKVVGFSSIARDITERIKSQEQLKLLNTQLSSLIQNMYTGILLENSEGKIVLVNNKFCELFAIRTPQEQLIGYDCNLALEKLQAIFQDSKKIVEDISTLIRDKKTKLAVEVKLINGKILERDFIPITIEGKYYGHMWQYKDVTDERLAQEVLRKNEEKYRRIIQNMNLGLLLVDNNDVILDVNPSFCEMTGYQKEEIVGLKANKTFIQKENQPTLDNARKLRIEGKSNAYELQIHCKDGSKKWVLVSGAPTYDLNQNYTGSIGIHLDITERKLQEQLLQDAQQKAESSMRSKEIFLANMSHEIRTPMNAVIGMTDLLNDAQLNPKERSYLEAIKKSSENLLVILNDILDFSKIDSGKLELESHPFSFNELITNLFLQFEFKALEKNISLSKEIDPKINPYLWGDSIRLNQVLMNLFSNSLKFTTEGSVKLTCKLLKDNTDAQEIEFSISDTGIGIDNSKLENIFESFIQEDSSINRKYGGSGLGLSISKQIINLFGGDIDVISEKGVGSTFKFTIELKKADKNAIQIESEAPTENILIDARVLLVEDNNMNQLIATTFMEQVGIYVDKALNGEEALHKLKTNSYDVILMDIQMPVMDGFKATQIIRSNNNNTPIIALTANAIKGDKEKYLMAGMNDYLSKPFNKTELIKKIIQLLPSNHLSITTDKHHKESTTDPHKKSYDTSNLLQESGNNINFVNSIVTMFIDLAKETDAIFSSGITSESQLEKIKSQAHKIKASIDVLEIAPLKNLVREIEKFDVHNSIEEVKSKLQLFTKLLSITVNEMKTDQLNPTKSSGPANN